MKRLSAVLLGMALVFSLAAPALAETDTEEALAEVTAHVAEVLDIPEDFSDFTGSFSGAPLPVWDLYWSKDGEDLSVRAAEDGLITEVYRWMGGESYDRFYGYDAAFPKLSEAEAVQRAETWLRKLAGENESFRVDDTEVSLQTDGAYAFSGRVLKNGLESPVTFRIRLSEAGLLGFDRSDSYRGYVGQLPPARASLTAAQAAPLLRDAVDFALYYVSDGDTARLRYVPVGPYTVVDALTGEAVDMDALYAGFDSRYYGPETPMEAEASAAAADNGAGRGLTEVELSSIANYGEALSREQLDAAMRAFGDLGLGDFTLDRCAYSMDTEGNITAALRYTCEMTADNLFGYSQEEYWEHLDWGDVPMVMKHVTADAKTGALQSVYTSYSLWERDDAVSAAPDQAERFLRIAAPDMAGEAALCTLPGYNEGEGFTFARVHDGYFYPENTLYVELNPAAGTVDTYYCTWDEDVIFAPSKGLVTEAAALESYTDALALTLGYTAWPEAIDYDDPVLYAYADWGYSFVESLRLTYYYGGLDAVAGVDALTGEPVRQAEAGSYFYDDLAGVPEGAMIEALGAAGIGFAGGSFRPDAALTMEDAARLLVSSAGYPADDWDPERLRDEAVWYGFVTSADWDPARVLTWEEFIQMLLTASRYGDAAALEGVGYERIARALGMTDGPLPAGPCTRADAAALLYRFMSR